MKLYELIKLLLESYKFDAEVEEFDIGFLVEDDNGNILNPLIGKMH